MSTHEMEARVARGSELLDHERPGWYRRIDTKRLQIQSCIDCILGQEFGRFSAGIRKLHLSLGNPLGFALNTSGKTDFERRVEYNDLTALWIEEIEARLLMDELGNTEDVDSALVVS